MDMDKDMEGVGGCTGEEQNQSDGGDDTIPAAYQNVFSSFVSNLNRATKSQIAELKRKEQAWLGEKEAFLKTIREKEEGHKLEVSAFKDKENDLIREKEELVTQIRQKDKDLASTLSECNRKDQTWQREREALLKTISEEEAVRKRVELENSELKDKERDLTREKEELSHKIRQHGEEMEGSRRELEGRVSSLEGQLKKEQAQSRRLMRTERMIQQVKEDLEETTQKAKDSVDRFRNRILEKLLVEEESGTMDIPSTKEGSEWEANNEIGGGGKSGEAVISVEGEATTPVPSSTSEGSREEVVELPTPHKGSNLRSGKSSGAFSKRKAETANGRANHQDSDEEDGSILTESVKKARIELEPPREHGPFLESHNDTCGDELLALSINLDPLPSPTSHAARIAPFQGNSEEKETEDSSFFPSSPISFFLSSPSSFFPSSPISFFPSSASQSSEGEGSNNDRATGSDNDNVEGGLKSNADVQSNSPNSNSPYSDPQPEDATNAADARNDRSNQDPGSTISNILKERFIQLKCPDCNDLFEDFRSILLHRKNSESCSVHYDPSKSIRVEVFAPPMTADEATCPTVAAVIDLPQAIFICEDCDLALYSSLDIARHRELHGDFRCDFCNFKCTYAPDLAYHELQHSRILNKMVGDGREPEGPVVSCVRCHLIFPSRSSAKEYVHHYVDKYLHLVLNEPICPICKTTAGNLSERELLQHLKTYHDLNKLTPPESKLRCGRSHGNCDAYFLSTAQLDEHVKVQHLNLNSASCKWRDCKCKKCGEIFINQQDFKQHGIVHSTTPGLFACPVDGCPTTSLMTSDELRKHILKDLALYVYARSLKVSGKIKLKCPDCELLFWEPKELLLHRKESNSCQGVYDITKTIRVELLITPRKEKKVSELLVNCVYAVIKLPQQLYVCDEPDCGRAVYTILNFKTHKHHHGIFHCQFCDAQQTCAPDMALHELRHHSTYTGNLDKIGTAAAIKCPRCQTSVARGLGNFHLINHYLLTINHLFKPKPFLSREIKCPICQPNASFHTSDNCWGAYNLANHFREKHNIMRPSTPKTN